MPRRSHASVRIRSRCSVRSTSRERVALDAWTPTPTPGCDPSIRSRPRGAGHDPVRRDAPGGARPGAAARPDGEDPQSPERLGGRTWRVPRAAAEKYTFSGILRESMMSETLQLVSRNSMTGIFGVDTEVARTSCSCVTARSITETAPASAVSRRSSPPSRSSKEVLVPRNDGNPARTNRARQHPVPGARSAPRIDEQQAG